jgi:putative peptidoglycan lipid II flippase
MPLSIIGVALGTALLPILARKFKNNEIAEAKKTLMHGIEIGLVLALPCGIALLIIAHPILDILFVRGAFTHEAAAASAKAIQAFAIGIPAFVMVKVLSAAFFAKEDTMTPVKFALIGAAFNTVLSIVLMQFMAHVGIALASTLTACLNMLLLGHGLMKREIVVLTKHDYKRLLFITVSSIVMGIFLFLSNHFVLNKMLVDSHDLTRFLALGLLIGIGGLSYLASIHFTKIYTVQDLFKLLRSRKEENKS